MIFTNTFGPNIEITAPKDVNFNVLPVPIFFKMIYRFLYKNLDNTKLYPHIDFDTANKNLLIGIAEKHNVRIEVNSFFEKKISNAEWDKNKSQKALLLFLKYFPDFYIFLLNVNSDVETSIMNAELLIGSNTNTLNFIRIKKIIDNLNKKRWRRPLDVKEKNSGVSILGNISEKLLEMAMEDLIDNINFFRNSISAVQSYGDFVLMCLPNNLWLSVKSNFARERLLASGYTTDIIGVGFFTDAKEFTSQSKIRNFSKVGFLAMYVPDIPITDDQVTSGLSTYEEIENYYLHVGINMPKNINGTEFIRKLSSIYDDVKLILDETDIRKRNTISF